MKRWMTPVSEGMWPPSPRLAPPMLLCLWALLASACSDSRSPAADSETHFLVACETICGGGLNCICGVCTMVCDPASECSGQSDAASCVPLDAFADEGACSGEVHSDSLSVCDLECERDADCRELSSAHACEAGRCRAGPDGAADPARPLDGAATAGEGSLAQTEARLRTFYADPKYAGRGRCDGRDGRLWWRNIPR